MNWCKEKEKKKDEEGAIETQEKRWIEKEPKMRRSSKSVEEMKKKKKKERDRYFYLFLFFISGK